MSTCRTASWAAATVGLAFYPMLLAAPALAEDAAPAAVAGTSPIAAAIDALASDRMVSARVALSDLGIDAPINLSGMDARRDLFFPVPAGVPVRDAVISLDGRYLRGDGGRTSYVSTVDGTPIVARAVGEDQGAVADVLNITGEPRRTGFVNLNVAWSSTISQDWCGDERSIANIFTISPATRLSYRYDRNDINDIATAWSALPPHPMLLVAGGPMATDAYDAAWRLGVVLTQAGKPPRVRVLPRVGETIDIGAFDVPAPLRQIPAFHVLANGGSRTIASEAEVGALLMLAHDGGADIVIDSAALRGQTDTALAALEKEVGSASPDAAAAFARWKDGAFRVPASNENVRLVTFAGRPAIAVAPGAGAAAAGLLNNLWRGLAGGVSLGVASARTPDLANGSSVAIAQLGGQFSSIDVMARSDWSATFDLGTLAAGGKVPAEFQLDVSAAPGAGASAPIASVFVNDYLLGARSLTADGRPERISVTVPHYALAARNLVRVSFQRQPSGDRCKETPQAFPAQVLPSSRVILGEAPHAVDFVGVVPRLGGMATLIVPRTYTADPASLTRVIALASASGLSAQRAAFTVADDAAAAKSDTAFLALDVRVAGAEPKVRIEGGRLVLQNGKDAPLLDISGLKNLGIVEAVDAGGQLGIAYRTLGEGPQHWNTPFLLGRGDVSVLSGDGPVATLDTRAPGGIPATAENRTFASLLTDRSSGWPLAAGGGVLGFLCFVVLAQRARRRAHTRHDAGS